MSLTALRDHLRDERVWCVAARVALHDGDSQHYDTAKNGQMIISVRTLRHDVPIWAMLPGGGEGIGVWFIPPIGTEVIVSFDDGMFEGDAYIVGLHGHAPTLQPGTLLVQGSIINVGEATDTSKVTVEGQVINLGGALDTPGPTGEGVVIGTGIDPFTGKTYNILGNASTKVFAKKLP